MWSFELITIILGLLFQLQTLVFCQKNSVTIKTRLGKVKGLQNKTVWKNITYYSFKGLRYAEPLIGETKFDMPSLNDKIWNDTFEAIDESSPCPQIQYLDENKMLGDEDCLRLNIYTPCLLQNQSENNTKLPVMIYIHSGQFISGIVDQDNVGPDFLMPHDVILVTLNFRLGPLGFLNTGTKDAPGNAQLKDQAIALKWVNKNIADYCGDPNKVTLFGNGAGGKAVLYHTYSPMSKGIQE